MAEFKGHVPLSRCRYVASFRDVIYLNTSARRVKNNSHAEGYLIADTTAWYRVLSLYER
jgi:hypothetical protein